MPFNRVRKFWRLALEEKRLLLRAFHMLGLMRWSVLNNSFKHLIADLTLHRDDVELEALDSESLAIAHSVGWAVRTAALYTPWQSNCLVQALAAQRMLQQRGVAGVFYLGATTVTRQADQSALTAHAWLKCNQEFITGELGHQDYTVVSTFSWP